VSLGHEALSWSCSFILPGVTGHIPSHSFLPTVLPGFHWVE